MTDVSFDVVAVWRIKHSMLCFLFLLRELGVLAYCNSAVYLVLPIAA